MRVNAAPSADVAWSEYAQLGEGERHSDGLVSCFWCPIRRAN